jgi:hypothetical protein
MGDGIELKGAPMIKRGDFVMTKEQQERVIKYCDMLLSFKDVANYGDRKFATAFMQIASHKDYKHSVMCERLLKYKRPSTGASIQEHWSALVDTYNGYNRNKIDFRFVSKS